MINEVFYIIYELFYAMCQCAIARYVIFQHTLAAHVYTYSFTKILWTGTRVRLVWSVNAFVSRIFRISKLVFVVPFRRFLTMVLCYPVSEL